MHAARLEHPVSIVTGAGSGIGRALALALAARRHRLVVVGRRRDALRETLALAASTPAFDAEVLALDVAERGEAAIRAFNIAAGAVETAMLRSILPESALGRDHTLDPAAVAAVVLECFEGARDDMDGKTILLHSP